MTALALAALLSLGAAPSARTFAQEASPQTDNATASQPEDATAGLKVKLYYFRDAAKIVTLLNAIATPSTSELNGLVVAQASDDEVILYGRKSKRDQARRIIAALDLPRPGINMEMWGIQISSRKPEKMAQVMPLIRAEIERTQQAVRATYAEMQRLTLQSIPPSELDAGFRDVLVKDLRYNSSLDENRAPSLADILLRMVAAREPGAAAANIANGLDAWLRRSPFGDYVDAMGRAGARSGGTQTRRPFERFFGARGLRPAASGWADPEGRVGTYALQGRVALLEFALYYGRLIHQPQSVDPYRLQQSADALNTRLQYATDAINADMQDLFVAPTLERIQVIVRGFKDVEYAQVGKVSVASLSGIPTVVTSKSVNTFDVTPPLRLSELLTKAKTLSDGVAPFVPNPAENVVGAMPLSQVIGLVAALGEDRAVWRELNSGVSVTVTPNVLRNMNSAELKVDLKTGDPVSSGTTQQGVPPLSRVSQHDVTTSIYVNALDFFDLSAFASQSTLSGGRGYVPIVGPVWRGLFGEIPVAGKLFSWRRSPQTVFSESLILTTSFITPTAMGVAVLYPTDLVNEETGEKVEYTNDLFRQQWAAVMRYESMLHRR
ncbi:MAG TPA: hypothetical protein VM936_21710 [Pyrinomonadaceae bacterium]|nr:hypothetical protein [Pyrinomonadaceae bacterium]